MGRDWILDVLADLRSFARANDMPLLSDRLKEAETTAMMELQAHPSPCDVTTRPANQTADTDQQRP